MPTPNTPDRPAPDRPDQHLQAPAVTPAPPPGASDGGPGGGPGGRPLTAGVAMLATAVGVVGMLVGGLLAVVGVTGHVFGAWPSPVSLTPGLLGAAMLGTSPGLFAVGRARSWQEARTLVLPTVIVVVGLFAVSVANVHRLYIARGGSVVPVLFSLGWLFVLGVLCLSAVICLAAQYLTAAGPSAPRSAPLPAWSRPALAVLGSSWLGIGAGLVVRPGFWADFVPWPTDRADAQALGVWALALGVGVLGSLAEDDLARTRVALLALPGTGLALAVVLACRAGDVDWTSGPGLSLVCMVAGLLVAGASGRLLLGRDRLTAARPPGPEA
ncbi:hypothetical protein ACIQU5_08745 [Streptomyces sp. NPDC090306]|uniref:hypothetical protein n=1 Tax=Streptomyces sp. NPDC090306 TaxID=3365961 RepID=UPI00382DAECD